MVRGAHTSRLKFISGDSESGSYKGPTERGAAARPWCQPVEEPGEETRTAEASRGGPEGLASILRVWGQLRANDSSWPTFDGRYAS